MLSQEDNNYYMPPQGDEGDGSWKPHMQQQPGAPPHASKLNTWANKRNKNHGGFPSAGPPPNYNGAGSGGMYVKGGWPDGNNRHTPSDQNKVPWSDPLVDMQFESFCEDVFGMNLGPNQKMGPPPPNGTPHQWGNGPINQSTPWDIDARAGGNFNPEGLPGSAPRFMQPVSMDNGTGQWRSWEHDGGNFKNDFHHPGNFPPHMAGMGKMHGNFHMGAPSNNFVMQQPGGFNDRMMRNGPPQMQPHPNQAQQQQSGGGWMDNNKYGGGPGRFQAYGAPPQQAGPMNVMPPSMVGQRGAPFIPPPLAAAHPPHPGMQPPPMHQMPPNAHIQGAGPPTGHPGNNNGGGQFSVGTFSSATVGMVNIGTYQPNAAAAPQLNDDSVWHDPNGDLRKWQRDTGTAAWGDPTKQAGQQIRRWQQADENDPLAGHSASQLANAANQITSHAGQQSPDSSLKKGIAGGQEEEELVVPETGWGDLPPLNSGAPIPHAPPPGPPPQLAGNGAWMSQGSTPQPLTAQNQNAPPSGTAWADPQRSQQQNMPPTSHPNFYSQPPSSGTPTDWSRMSFGGSSGGFNPTGGTQQPSQQSGSFEGTPPVGQGSTQNQIGAGQDPSTGSTNEIADKLRMAASKGWIDPMVFCSNNKLSTHTANLLNTLINRLTSYEQNTAKISQLQRQESASGGAQAPNSSPQRAELDRLIRETAQMSNELTDLRDKIHGSMDGGQRANKGMSLVDELSNMNTMSTIGDVPLW